MHSNRYDSLYNYHAVLFVKNKGRTIDIALKNLSSRLSGLSLYSSRISVLLLTIPIFLRLTFTLTKPLTLTANGKYKFKFFSRLPCS